MKIQRTEPGILQSVQPRKQEPTNIQTADAQPSRASSSISSAAQSLEQARQAMTSLPDVDMDKVNNIRQALSEGKLELNMDALAQAIIEMHRR